MRKTLLLMLLLICRSAWPQVSDRAVVITHATVINPTSAYSSKHIWETNMKSDLQPTSGALPYN